MVGDNNVNVIIVLGAAQDPDGSPGPAMTRRVHHGARLFAAGTAPAMLLSGGPTRVAEPEAVTMRRVAVAAGVPAEAIFLERDSRRTFENAVECRAVMAEEGWGRGLLVTDDFHMRRALMSFQGLGLSVRGEPVANTLTPYVAAAHVREFFARQMYARMIRAYVVGKT